MVPEPVRTYMIHALEAGPLSISYVLSDNREWDASPNSERFSLREMVAHLADWEPIWLERVRRISTEDHPTLPSVDEGQLCAERDYAAQDPIANLARFRKGRTALVAAIKALPEDAWARTAHRGNVGDLDFVQLVGMIIGHDGYHMKQALEITAKG